jgi:hypothetical protein
MKGKAMLAMGFSDLFQEGNGKSLQLLQVAGSFFAIVVLFKRSPIVEISALNGWRKSPIFNYL